VRQPLAWGILEANEWPQSFRDGNKAFDVCRDAQIHYAANGRTTIVMGASFTSVEEVMGLAGVQHITVMPDMLRELASTSVAAWKGDIGTYMRPPSSPETTPSDGRAIPASPMGKESERKMGDAVYYFTRAQKGLEDLIRQVAATDV
jgi:transaldolase